MSVAIGDPLPEVTVYTADAEAVGLPSLVQQKPTVLLFFPAAHTRTCEKELCTFRDSLTAYNHLGARVFGISVDSPFTLKAYAQQLGLEFPLISDFHKEATRALGLEIGLRGIMGFAQRAAYVVAPDGRIRWCWVAEVPSQEPPYEAVAEAVRALG